MGLNYDRWAYYTKDLESPDIFLEWGFISLIGSALQRRVWYYPDEDTYLPGANSLFLNNFVTLVGPPATGKGRVIKQVNAAVTSPVMHRVTESGRMIPLIKYSPDKITCERLIDVLGECTDMVDYEVVVKDKKEKRGCAHASLSCLIEELEVLFSSNAGDMVSVLNQCFDAGNLHYQTRTQARINIKNVCVNMLAGTTPEAIRGLFTDKVIKTGFTSRVIAVYAKAPRFYRDFPGMSAPQRAAFIELLTHVKKLSTAEAGEITLSDDARAFFKEYYESGKMIESRPNKHPKLDNYYGRKKVHWLKLAAIKHFSEDHTDRTVTLTNMQDALNMLDRTEVDMHEVFQSAGKNLLHENCINIVRYLLEHGETRYKKIHLDTYSELTKDDLDECLLHLLATDQIRNNNQQTEQLDKGMFTASSARNGELKPLTTE